MGLKGEEKETHEGHHAVDFQQQKKCHFPGGAVQPWSRQIPERRKKKFVEKSD